MKKHTNVQDYSTQDEAALSQHMKTEHQLQTVNDFNKCFSFTILELDPKNLDKCEQKWVNTLKTMQPYGLNIEHPCGVVDQLLKV